VDCVVSVYVEDVFLSPSLFFSVPTCLFKLYCALLFIEVKKYLVPKLVLQQLRANRATKHLGLTEGKGLSNKSLPGKVVGRNMKLGKLHRNLFEQTFENICLFLIVFPRCFPGQPLSGVPGGSLFNLAARQIGAGSSKLGFTVEDKDQEGFVCANGAEKYHSRESSTWERGSAADFSDCASVLHQRFSSPGNGKMPRSCNKIIKVTHIFNSNQPLVLESCRHSNRL